MAQLESLAGIGYAGYRLRFRAFLVDTAICMGLFFVGGLGAAVMFEKSPLMRILALIVIVALVLAYEPFMVGRYGGTVGHRAMNIRVVDAATQLNLSIGKAILRSLIKLFFGVFSFSFMFVTKRAQGLHDLAAGAEVKVRNQRSAAAVDYFVPTPAPAGHLLPSPLRRVIVILAYNVFAFLLLTVLVAISVSFMCIDLDICSVSDQQNLSILSYAWLVGVAILIGLGWTGRLPGCRKRPQNR